MKKLKYSFKCPKITKFLHGRSLSTDFWYFEEKIDFVEKVHFKWQFSKHAQNGMFANFEKAKK